MEPVKRRATRDLVSSVNRVDSGIGDDTPSRLQYAYPVRQTWEGFAHYQNKQEDAQPTPERRSPAGYAQQMIGNVSSTNISPLAF
jgi:hypothetical protein